MCFLQNEAPFFLLVFKRRGAFWAADFCTKHFAHAEFNSKQTFFFSRSDQSNQSESLISVPVALSILNCMIKIGTKKNKKTNSYFGLACFISNTSFAS